MADPISAAATALATAITAGSASSVVYFTAYAASYAAITAGVSLGLSAIAKASVPDAEGQKITRKQARPIRVHAVGGPSRMSGAFMLREAVGNKYGAVLAVCEGRLASVDAVYEHDNRITRNAEGWVQGMPGEQFGSGDLLRIQTRLGNPTETHYSMLTPNFGAYWPTTARGDGIASIGIFAQHRSRESFARHFPNGEPSVSIVGAPVCYDWRDPTQSLNDPSTWKASWNPVVWLVFVEWHRHGRRWERSIAPVLDQLTAEANYCDQIVTRSGVTEARYRCAGNYPVNTEPQAVREALLSTFDGWMSLDGRGRLIVKAGRYVEPTFVLTGEHIQGYSWRAFQTDEEACNALVVSFVDPAKDYTEVEAGTLFDQDDIDGRNGVERSEALQLPWCPSGTQAMELARRKMTRLTAARRGQVRASVYGLNGLGERFIRIRNHELRSMTDVVVEVTNVELDMANAQVVFDVVLADTEIDAGEAAAPSVPPVVRPPLAPGEQEPARRLINLSVPYPTSATSDTISIVAFSGVLPDGSSISLPAATITGLAPLTQYGVFWRSDVGYAALPGDFASNALALGSWIFVGWQATSDGAGSFPSSPPPPPGWGGGGNAPIYEQQAA